MVMVTLVSEGGKRELAFINPNHVLYCTDAGENTRVELTSGETLYVEGKITHVALEFANAK